MQHRKTPHIINKNKIKYLCNVSGNYINKTQTYTILILEEHQQDPVKPSLKPNHVFNFPV
jgi:hypothetical protein